MHIFLRASRRDVKKSPRKIYTFARYSHDHLHLGVDFSLRPDFDCRIFVRGEQGASQSCRLF